MADVEMVTTAIDVLAACSDGSFSLELGDAGVFKELMRELNATPEERENIRYLIETKNYPALNDVLDTMGDSKIAAALKNCRRCSAEKRFSTRLRSCIPASALTRFLLI